MGDVIIVLLLFAILVILLVHYNVPDASKDMVSILEAARHAQ
jgi:hypothetical protein